MIKNFTLEYWIDNEWYVGRLKEIPNIFSQGKTLSELEENIKDAYDLLLKDQTDDLPEVSVQTKELTFDV